MPWERALPKRGRALVMTGAGAGRAAAVAFAARGDRGAPRAGSARDSPGRRTRHGGPPPTVQVGAEHAIQGFDDSPGATGRARPGVEQLAAQRGASGRTAAPTRRPVRAAQPASWQRGC